MPTCHDCGAPLPRVERIGRRDVCLACDAELHCCANCRFHTPGMHNDCAEPQAERVADKLRANFCDYFAVRPDTPAAANRPAASARTKLDDLFRKRPS